MDKGKYGSWHGGASTVGVDERPVPPVLSTKVPVNLSSYPISIEPDTHIRNVHYFWTYAALSISALRRLQRAGRRRGTGR